MRLECGAITARGATTARVELQRRRGRRGGRAGALGAVVRLSVGLVRLGIGLGLGFGFGLGLGLG